MKKSKLIEELKILGLDLAELESDLLTITNGYTIAEIDNKSLYVFDTNFFAYKNLPFETQEKLYNLLTVYAATPIEERLDSYVQLNENQLYILEYLKQQISSISPMELIGKVALNKTYSKYYHNYLELSKQEEFEVLREYANRNL